MSGNVKLKGKKWLNEKKNITNDASVQAWGLPSGLTMKMMWIISLHLVTELSISFAKKKLKG